MKNLNCFASEFSLMPSRLIFQQKETPSEKPAEQHELTKEQAEGIMQAIHNADIKMDKYELPGSSKMGGAVRHDEGDFFYNISVFDEHLDSGVGIVEAHVLQVNKSQKGGMFSSDEFIGTLSIKYEKNKDGSFKLKMTYQPEDKEARFGGEEKEMARAEFKDGKYNDNNGAALKGKADKFLKILNDYIRANTPKTPGSKEIRDF